MPPLSVAVAVWAGVWLGRLEGISSSIGWANGRRRCRTPVVAEPGAAPLPPPPLRLGEG